VIIPARPDGRDAVFGFRHVARACDHPSSLARPVTISIASSFCSILSVRQSLGKLRPLARGQLIRRSPQLGFQAVPALKSICGRTGAKPATTSKPTGLRRRHLARGSFDDGLARLTLTVARDHDFAVFLPPPRDGGPMPAGMGLLVEHVAINSSTLSRPAVSQGYCRGKD